VRSLSVMVVPVEAGGVVVAVAVTDGVNSAAANATLHVELEGSAMSVSKALYLDPYDPAATEATLNVSTPRNIVPGSLKIKLSTFGSVLGPVAEAPLTPLTPLVRGSGEMVAAAMTDILTGLSHLQSTATLSGILKERAAAALELHLQTLLRHRLPEGSFVEFAEYRDPMRGSTWLTAFVAKTLRAAQDFIFVPSEVISDALAWLVKRQADDGVFLPDAEASPSSADVDASPSNVTATRESVTARRNAPLALTAYVLLSILQVEDYTTPAVRNAGNRALDRLVSALRSGESADTLALATATYAMHVAGHPYRDTAFFMLEAQATTEDDKKWWADGTGSGRRPSLEDPSVRPSLAVEQTAYALATYARRGSVRDAAPIVSWLQERRNHRGGFTSSQDTSVGLSALAQVAAAHAATGAAPRSVRLVYGGRGSRVSVDGPLTADEMALPDDTTSVSITAAGSHAAVVQLSYTYRVRVTAPRPAFSLDPQLDRTTDANRLRLTVCTGLITTAADPEEKSGLAVLEVALPSGYVIDDADLPGLYDYPMVARVQRLSGEGAGRGGVALYLRGLGAAEVCPTVTASRVTRVARQRPAAVRIYDYYDLTRQARQFYSALPATLCDICDVAECDSQVCDKRASMLERQRQDPEEFGYPAVVVLQNGAASLFSASLAAVLGGSLLSVVSMLQR